MPDYIGCHMLKKMIMLSSILLASHVWACSDGESEVGEIRIYKSYYTYSGRKLSTKTELKEALKNYSKKEVKIYIDPCADENDREEIQNYLAGLGVESFTIGGSLCACEE